MSYFGNDDKDHLVDEITEFLKNYKVSTLLEVVSYAIYCEEDDDDSPTITEYDLHSAMAAGYKDGFEMAKAKFERPHGEWKLDSIGVYCSECRKHPDYSSDFCPLCGADMRGDGECQK